MAAPTSVHSAASKAEPWLQRFARLGFAAKGAIYALIGVLALMAATGLGGKETNQAGAINAIGEMPGGKVLLLTIAIGLVAYSIWRFVQALFDPAHKNALKRILYVITALAYGGIAWMALKLALADQKAESDPQNTTSKVLEMPGGEWILGAVAAAFMVGMLVQIWNGLSGKFMKVFKYGQMSDDQQATARWIGGFGLVARGLLFGVIGYFLGAAALNHNGNEAGGIDKALTTIAQMPFGLTLFAVLATGLISYGVLMWFQARYRDLTPVTQGGEKGR